MAVGIAGAAWWWATAPLTMRSSPTDFRILPGSGLRSASLQIQAAGVQLEPDLMVLLARFKHAEGSIKAGSYSVVQGITPLQLLDKMTRGEVSQGELLLPEGWSFRQWRARVDQHPDLQHSTSQLTETELIAKLGISATKIEGLLFPDTYLFDKQSTDLELYARAQRAMQSRLDAAWAQRAPGLPYKTPYEALIMASIVEKETGRDADRPMVASVFVNRLRLGMLLQTDPTVIYGLGSTFDGNLRKQHLRSDTPYNTYTRAGLPPSPIAMPGNNSLLAAMNPASSDALYFVARGDGSSQFSRTLDEHNQAVNKYQRGAK
ncbi:MAG: endolytic transglycosylase MltG [Rhodocyclaceae bacterium]|nr:endolytic transglycosylase MltG [Rhodocyclaceae bacterium]